MPDYELLELLLFAALPRGDTKPLAKTLLARFGSFARAITAPEAELRAIPGVGDAVLASLRLARAAALRLLAQEARQGPVLDNWPRLTAYLSAALSREDVEQFRILFLDSRNRLLADEAQARGTLDHAPAYPREVVRRALELGAAAVILVHNHPSGDVTPSRADIDLTRIVMQAARHLDIAVHDHIVIGTQGPTSLRAQGLM